MIRFYLVCLPYWIFVDYIFVRLNLTYLPANNLRRISTMYVRSYLQGSENGRVVTIDLPLLFYCFRRTHRYQSRSHYRVIEPNYDRYSCIWENSFTFLQFSNLYLHIHYLQKKCPLPLDQNKKFDHHSAHTCILPSFSSYMYLRNNSWQPQICAHLTDTDTNFI